MHWQDQRNMILRYATAPANSEVYKQLPQLQADKLKECFKKNNIDDLEAIHKKNKVTKEKELIAAKSRVDTLEGQLQGVEPQDIVTLQEELVEVEKAIYEGLKRQTAYKTQLAEFDHKQKLER
jgi:hypothetical protein